MFFKPKINDAKKISPVSNGAFDIRYAGLDLHVEGGPFRDAEKFAKSASLEGLTAMRVKMAAEQPGYADVTVAVHDFTAPDPDQLADAVEKSIKAMLRGAPLYVGCGAGIGRTGTLIAAIIKVFYPSADPVKMTREHYLGYAVETPDQKKLLAEFDVAPIRKKLWWWAIKARFGAL